MKRSTLKIAVFGLLAVSMLSAPTTAEAKKSAKAWKHQAYCDPMDVGCMMSNGQWKSGGSAKKTVVARRGPDCGEDDAQTARGLNMAGTFVGFIPVAGTFVSAGISVAGSEVAAQAEKKQWNCFERSVKSQVASGIKGIERQYAAQISEMQGAMENMALEYDEKIASLQAQVALRSMPPPVTQLMQPNVCTSTPALCSFGTSAEPKLLSEPKPAERPKVPESPAKSAPSSDDHKNTQPGRPGRPEKAGHGDFPNYAGSFGKFLSTNLAAK